MSGPWRCGPCGQWNNKPRANCIRCGADRAGGNPVTCIGYTPGPWIYGVRADGSMYLSIGDRKRGPHYQGDLVATEDDARLIVAAPYLLDALQLLCVFAGQYQDGDADLQAVIEVARNAINKAVPT